MTIVKVTWHDSKGVASAWEFKDELKPLPPVHIVSVGIMMEHKDDYITIVQCDSKDQVLGRLTIPRGCIEEIRHMNEGVLWKP